MRNKYPGICYRCKQYVETGAGHFEGKFDHWRQKQVWLLQHAECAIKYRGTSQGKQ